MLEVRQAVTQAANEQDERFDVFTNTKGTRPADEGGSLFRGEGRACPLVRGGEAALVRLEGGLLVVGSRLRICWTQVKG